MVKRMLIRIFERVYPTLRRIRFNIKYRFHVMSPDSTIAYIKKAGCSVARYGDGEFGLITKRNNPDFQECDAELSTRLEQVCNTHNPHLLICIPRCFKSVRDCNKFASDFWEWWCWGNNNLEDVAHILKLNPQKIRIFGDAQITRPYIDWKNKKNAGRQFKKIQGIWNGRDVLVVEGALTRMGVGNRLLQNANSVNRLIAPAKNAFTFYDEILKAAVQYGKGKIVLIALGPTATVLAYDLSMEGIQAIDIGHIDTEYEWFLSGATEKTPIAGKAVQEVHATESNQNENTSSEDFQQYLSQIIKKIGC